MTPCCDVHSLLNRQKCGLEVRQRHNERLTQSICPFISPTLPKIHSDNYLLRFQGDQWRTQKVEIHQSTRLRAPHFWMFCDITDTHLTPLQGQWQQFQSGVSSSLRGYPAPTPTFCSSSRHDKGATKQFLFKVFFLILIFLEKMNQVRLQHYDAGWKITIWNQAELLSTADCIHILDDDTDLLIIFVKAAPQSSGVWKITILKCV